MSRQRLVALVGAASFSLAGCGLSQEADAPLATVSVGTEQIAEISRSEVSSALDEIASSDRFMQVVYANGITEDDQRDVLSRMVRAKVLEHEANALGLTADIGEAEQQLEDQLASVASNVDPGDPAVAASEMRVELGAYFDTVATSVAYETALRERFATEAEGGLPCVSHILVAPEDEAKAEDLLSQLADGADFASLAAGNSIDTQSAVSGGDLGCADPQQYVPEFRDAVLSAAVDEVVGPIQSSFGYHIIKVTGYDNSAAVGIAVAAIFDDVSVAIDPAFGEWNTDTDSVVEVLTDSSMP